MWFYPAPLKWGFPCIIKSPYLALTIYSPLLTCSQQLKKHLPALLAIDCNGLPRFLCLLVWFIFFLFLIFRLGKWIGINIWAFRSLPKNKTATRTKKIQTFFSCTSQGEGMWGERRMSSEIGPWPSILQMRTINMCQHTPAKCGHTYLSLGPSSFPLGHACSCAPA